ncbi:MAG: SusF/SusE family outer membrane protein, partial [Flammeovirgaceae bacterium]|nr:SusF/SusE family outer membrane protein [Flammeovirgaceae bacterium]MDW8286825.1 SusF/SusE family outer membrane protein [Flammeovirgaceae bacterium]
MKINYKLFWLWTLLAAFLFGSCEKEDMKPESQLAGGKRVAPVLSSIPPSNFVLKEEDKNKTLVNAFSWQAANFDLFIYADIVYSLELDRNANFSAPKTLFSGTQRSFSIKIGDLNRLLLSMGVETTTPINFRVKAEVKNSQIQPLISNVLTLPVTPYVAFDKMVLNGTATEGKDIAMANVGGNTHRWTVIADLKVGKVRFIGDTRFVFGGKDFPSGKAVRDGAEINIPEAGRYRIDFDDQTLDYKFAFGYERVGIIGSGTTGNDTGWGQDIAMRKNGNDWSLYIYLYKGEVKFRANNSWTVNWGGSGFPEGTGTQDGPNIKIDNAGWYFVQFNDLSGAYKFTSVKVGIIGDATPGGWGTPTFMTPAGGRNWSIAINLEAKEMKFRLGNDWTVNWGGTGFPTGVGTQDGPNIKIPNAGFYVINFNDETGAYSFSTGFNTIGIIGNATTGSHDTGWAQDIDMRKNENNPAEWSIVIYLYQGELKFRANDSWTVNWGANSFPTGVGVQDGPNIPVNQAGYYSVVFNSATGAYTFTRLTPTVYTTVGIIG